MTYIDSTDVANRLGDPVGKGHLTAGQLTDLLDHCDLIINGFLRTTTNLTTNPGLGVCIAVEKDLIDASIKQSLSYKYEVPDVKYNSAIGFAVLTPIHLAMLRSYVRLTNLPYRTAGGSFF
jgi:hypothetical protein